MARQVIMLWPPRTAGMSVFGSFDPLGTRQWINNARQSVDRLASIVTFQHSNGCHVLRRIDRSACFVIGCIRDPVDRFVSIFQWCKAHPKLPEMYLPVVNECGGTLEAFADFVFLGDGAEPIGNSHSGGNHFARPQADWLCDKDDVLIPDLLMRHDRMGEGWDRLHEALEIPSTRLLHHNKSKPTGQTLSASMVKAGREYYSRDYEIIRSEK